MQGRSLETMVIGTSCVLAKRDYAAHGLSSVGEWQAFDIA